MQPLAQGHGWRSCEAKEWNPHACTPLEAGSVLLPHTSWQTGVRASTRSQPSPQHSFVPPPQGVTWVPVRSQPTSGCRAPLRDTRTASHGGLELRGRR